MGPWRGEERERRGGSRRHSCAWLAEAGWRKRGGEEVHGGGREAAGVFFFLLLAAGSFLGPPAAQREEERRSPTEQEEDSFPVLLVFVIYREVPLPPLERWWV